MAEPILLADDVADQRETLAEPMLTDVCTITIPDADAPPPVLDEETGQYPAAPSIVIYGPGAVDAETREPASQEYRTGRCRFQIKADINSNIIETTAGDREWTYATSQLQIPVSALQVPIDSIVTCISAAYNPALPNRVFNIHGEIAPKSIPVIRRFRLREVVA